MNFPVSIKGVVFRDDRAILLRNERDEWELPIVTDGCTLDSAAPVAISSEHKEVGFFRVGELDALPMPEGYRASVRQWWNHCLSTG
ncbi:MAG TPA: hypothetical protein VFB93_07180 [Burkholderiales bacterium]|nr:hypothetical protein [Burkholderiales bacterium]